MFSISSGVLSRSPTRSFTLFAGGFGLLTDSPAVKTRTFHGIDDAKRNSNMKTFALGVLLGLALTAQGFAIIRSPYPVKPTPPYHGRFIMIGDDAISQPASKAPK